jgi:hypothetical protein
MTWVRHRGSCIVVGGATLRWVPNNEPDLAGYRIYRCNHPLCTRTSLDIGTPAEVQYYFITADNSGDRESRPSSVVILILVGTPPPPEGLRVGSPN